MGAETNKKGEVLNIQDLVNKHINNNMGSANGLTTGVNASNLPEGNEWQGMANDFMKGMGLGGGEGGAEGMVGGLLGGGSGMGSGPGAGSIIGAAARVVDFGSKLYNRGAYQSPTGIQKPVFQLDKTSQLSGMSPMLAPVGLAWDIVEHKKGQEKYRRQLRNFQFEHDKGGRQQTAADADYTGQIQTVRKGGMGKGQVPVNMEADEIVVREGKDGNFKPVMQTPSTTPSHEQGGQNFMVGKGDLIFNRNYMDSVKGALGSKNNGKLIRTIFNKSMKEKRKAQRRGDRFSRGSTPKLKVNK
jgi:hypothetical protein